MMPDRMADLESQIRPTAGTPVNRDFAPVAYYFDVALWSGRFHHAYRDFFRALAAVRFRFVVAIVAALLIAAVAVIKRPSAIAACSTAASGFTMIGSEMLILLAFEAMYGYVYQQLALVIGLFMAGIALGSFAALRRPAVRSLAALALVETLIALLPLALCALFPLAGHFVFPLLALGAGLAGGFEFPIAARLFEGKPGTLYALDLAGSCVAAVIFSTWLIPVFGFWNAAIVTAMVAQLPR